MLPLLIYSVLGLPKDKLAAGGVVAEVKPVQNSVVGYFENQKNTYAVTARMSNMRSMRVSFRLLKSPGAGKSAIE